MRTLATIIAFLFAGSSVLLGQSSQSAEPTGKLKITVLDTIDRIIPNVDVTIQGNGLQRTFTSWDQASYDFDLPAGLYTISTGKGNGYNYPFRRSPFFVEAGVTTLINVLPPMRITAIGTSIPTGSFVDLAPKPKYQEYKVPDATRPEMSLVVQYDEKRERGKVIEYRDGARPFSGVIATYDALTVIADVIRLDKNTLQIEARGNVIIEDGKKRTHFQEKRIAFKEGKAIIED